MVLPTLGARLRRRGRTLRRMRSPHAIALAAVSLLLGAPSGALAQTCFGLPFSEGSITDPWGCAAACGRSTPHRGVDFGVGCGSTIPAIAAGVVVANEHSGCLGWVIAIQHADGMTSGYSHMPSQSPLPIGTVVARGDAIGVVGRNGTCAFGCHLHLTLGPSPTSWWTGSTIDPVAYIHAHEAGASCDDNGGVLLEQVSAYAPPTTTDIDGNGSADLCARASDGVHCFPSTGEGWDTAAAFPVVGWTDAGTWNNPQYYATIRMGDIDGDGRADLCARSASAFHCALSMGDAFGPVTVWLDGISDAGTWNRPEYYTTIRLVDANGDGRDDFCARHAAGVSCWLSDGATFARRIDGPLWSDASGFAVARYYGTMRMGDVNGDGRADVCIRGGAGMSCAISDGDGFPDVIAAPAWSDASGFGEPRFWTTLRMADVNGDGMSDLCIRTSVDYRCAFSNGTGFDEAIAVGALSDPNGWGDPSNYRTLRTGDVDGDGAEDICGRGDAEMGCWAWNGTTFVQRAGPAWSDASGWGASPAYFDTIRLADHDGDGRDDLCARSGAGWTCSHARGDGFGEVVTTDQLSDSGGWQTSPSYWSTIVSGGRCAVTAETCNGRDDDCDHTVDEDTCEDAAATRDGGAARDDGSAGADGGARRTPAVTGGCSCRATGAGSASWWLAAIPAVLLLTRRRRRALCG